MTEALVVIVDDRASPTDADPPEQAEGANLERPFRWATGVLVALLVVAAGSGLVLDVYAGKTPFARNGYRGADLVSLVAVVPLLALSALAAARGHGSVRARLVWLGGLGYVTYQYGYVFAYGWSRLFLVYLALLSLSAFTLVAALTRLDVHHIDRAVAPQLPAARLGGFLLVVGGALGLMELAQIVPSIVTGDPPALVVDTAHPTSPVYVLDLGLVVPLMLLGGTWVRRRRPWGWVLAPVLLVKGAAVGAGLLAANLFAALGDGRTDGVLNLLWAAIAVGSAAVLVRFLRSVRPTTISQEEREHSR